MSNKYDKMYLEIAHIIAKYSKAKNQKVGCVAVKGNTPISWGMNGTYNGCPYNHCEVDGITLPTVMHSEINCIHNTSIREDLKNSTLYVTHSPCYRCSVSLVKYKVSRVVYSYIDSDTRGIENLINNNIKVEKL